MTQIDELQSRILSAMERISAGVGKLEEAKASAEEEARAAADTSELERALDEEKTTNAQLEERVKTLHARLQEAGVGNGNAQAAGEDVAALKAELELLRNEVGNSDEKDALKQEVQRLKAELESVGNEAAALKEELETKVAELSEQKQALAAQIEEAGGGSDDVGAAVDQAALEAENAALKAQLEEAQSATDAPQAAGSDSEELIRLDTELQQLRLANEQLRKSNAELRSANAEGLADAELINAALEAEVEGLRAAKASDDAQVNAVLAKLEPLLASAQNLPEGEEA